MGGEWFTLSKNVPCVGGRIELIQNIKIIIINKTNHTNSPFHTNIYDKANKIKSNQK